MDINLVCASVNPDIKTSHLICTANGVYKRAALALNGLRYMFPYFHAIFKPATRCKHY